MRINLASYRNIVVLTGAGVSAGSGLRTYRGPDGVWEEHRVEEYGHVQALLERPDKTWKLFGAMRAPLRAAVPGSRNVVELHGNLGYTRCSNDACDLQPFVDDQDHAEAVPRCPKCSSVLRPNIVLFGEAIPLQAAWQVKLALRDCDLFVAIGTSGLVAPAANFVRSAEYAGARTIFINLEPMSPRNPAFQEELLGKAEEILPKLIDTEI